jgi:prepilin-type N-terminal cleavage/methylation domain-containing protein
MSVNNKGFTILELLIATSVFSVILLLCTFGLIQVGKSYYKGVALTRTQNVARNVMGTLTQSIQFSGDDPRGPLPRGSGPTPGSFCFGSLRYQYKLNSKVGTSGGYALRTSDCTQDALNAKQTELLGKGMSLQTFSVQPVVNDPNSYTISIKILYGDTDQLDNGNCKSGAGSQFCATASLNTIVHRRIN